MRPSIADVIMSRESQKFADIRRNRNDICNADINRLSAVLGTNEGLTCVGISRLILWLSQR